MLPKLQAALTHGCRIPRGAAVVVAVSGGADSMALLHAFHALAPRQGWRLTVAHLHHGIRGARADEDARFVRQAVRRLRLPCVVGRADVPALARRRGVSLEMAARTARYAFLLRTARRAGADVVATAHTADDQAETVLLKLLRGAGRTGLSGIAPETAVGGCRVVRPLLGVSRSAILAYLRQAGAAWREDETNADRSFLRNRVRHDLLPLLEREFNPRIRETLNRMSRIFAAEDEWLEELAARSAADCEVPAPGRDATGTALACDRLRRLPLAVRRRVLRHWLIRRGVPESCLDFETLERVTALNDAARGNKVLLLGEGCRVRRSYGRLHLGAADPAASSAFMAVLRVPGTTLIPGAGWRIVTRLAPGLVKERAPCAGTLPARASFSAAAWDRQAIAVRPWKAGDRMAPWGLAGTKKIQDILVDQKVPRAERQRLPVFESGGEIVWLPGYRVARSWAVTDPDALNLQVRIERYRSQST